MRQALRKSPKGFSLIELVIVVVIIGIIAAIAIPKMSRGATGASEAALTADLQVLRNALEMYQAEHNGQYPSTADIATQLTGLTDSSGNVIAPGAIGIIAYGPYIKTIPALPVGQSRTLTTISASGGSGVAWIYDPDAGTIFANSSATDGAGTAYNKY